MPVVSDVRILPDLDHMVSLQAKVTRHRFPAHCHDTFVIELVHAGVDACDVNRQAAKAGELFIHLPSVVHSGGTVGSTPLKYSAVYPTVRFMETIGLKSPFDGIAQQCLVLKDKKVIRTATALMLAAQSHQVIAVEFLLRELIGHARELCGDAGLEVQVDNQTMERLRLARKYIDSHCANDISLDELSGVAGLSKYHLVRSFRKQFGITPRQYLICRRVGLGGRLLATGENAARAALRAGFYDQSHFSRCFKRVTGFRPGQLNLQEQQLGSGSQGGR